MQLRYIAWGIASHALGTHLTQKTMEPEDICGSHDTVHNSLSFTTTNKTMGDSARPCGRGTKGNTVEYDEEPNIITVTGDEWWITIMDCQRNCHGQRM